ncbi:MULTISPECIES: YqgE/AlgH family protein [unclassified Rhizobium]|uniref:YqgE/AlgH family protein n=1 Tax=unclassified Rhizobium TaxID=2613769 RepID=UPI00161CE531|nr:MULTISPECIES: YqgE/AlgH family protein [unclassified Rhizobium]MBB3314676.1 putative transcriptional regulator [Rhizobium sp. BK181]MBB3539958.1 putative transcriptional regulator [Rhizobium sp. BK399]MCS3739032.1 putative transcriptional regulator [Rhizobium sp. BK661]MCS4090643.1 putative transcriptional regulator [Rhizobium sp. BK176]
MSLATLKNKRERGFFDGQFLIAMPGMEDRNFARTVIYICAHSDAGAMGFVINRPQNLTFTDVLLHLEMIKDEDAIVLPAHARDCPIQTGGPVESGRGFVLHSDDYLCDSSIPVSDDICMTATLDIIRAISKGKGPKRATMLLGYAGWGAGQLEAEVGNNGWLTCAANEELIFDRSLDDKYERALASMGINAAMLSAEAGHA